MMYVVFIMSHTSLIECIYISDWRV